MTWLQAPPRIRRFTRNQLAQHWLASGAAALLLLSSIAMIPGVPSFGATLHVYSGLASAVLLALHAAYLVGVGIRSDVPLEKVAFLPSMGDREAIRRGDTGGSEIGKYSPAEKADYFGIVLWSALVVATGLLLHRPAALGVPSVSAYGWVRTVHAGCGAAWLIHLSTLHVSRRWFDATPVFRRAILTGTVPLEEAERRGGWVADLVADGVLVPVPEEVVPEERKESQRVRDLLEEGNRLAREGDFDGARAVYEEALRLFPDYSQARFNLAVALARDGKKAEARAQLLLFLESDPFNPMTEKARDMLTELGNGGAE